jgi:hypothetical protein
MISPQLWKLKRPGILLPVFFLSLFPGSGAGQTPIPGSAVAALGRTFVSRSGYMAACQNQAGLGWAEVHSLSLQHSRPFMELGISVVAARLKLEQGALGLTFSSYGITGLRQSSMWISYGMKLSPQLSAGLGMQVQSSSIPEKSFYHPGLDLALGIQIKIPDRWVLGAHVASESFRQGMCISPGCAYTFFNTATLYLEFHIRPGQRIQLSHGLEWAIGDRISLMTGISNLPATWSGGLSVQHSKWAIHLAFQYISESGSIPNSSLHYAW